LEKARATKKDQILANKRAEAKKRDAIKKKRKALYAAMLSNPCLYEVEKEKVADSSVEAAVEAGEEEEN